MAVALTIGALLTVGASPGHAQPTGREAAPASRSTGVTLSCSLKVAAPGRIAFSPRVSTTSRRISARGTVLLDACTSPNGRQPRIRSGKLSLRGSGTATCSKVTGVRGSATVTWYAGANRSGRVVGRSVITPAGGTGGYTPLDRFLSGRVASGSMARHTVSGSAVPTNDVTQCLRGGLDHIQGRGRLKVS
ncbi:hypothetical protein ACIBK8_08085 [Streptomyces sp. NPDC050161]|uniref:hypothetical protein n=1 Tax=Streptomyces sp. NPDC050161 TaxID=3365604 RepID=UPI0037A8A1D0